MYGVIEKYPKKLTFYLGCSLYHSSNDDKNKKKRRQSSSENTETSQNNLSLGFYFSLKFVRSPIFFIFLVSFLRFSVFAIVGLRDCCFFIFLILVKPNISAYYPFPL